MLNRSPLTRVPLANAAGEAEAGGPPRGQLAPSYLQGPSGAQWLFEERLKFYGQKTVYTARILQAESSSDRGRRRIRYSGNRICGDAQHNCDGEPADGHGGRYLGSECRGSIQRIWFR